MMDNTTTNSVKIIIVLILLFLIIGLTVAYTEHKISYNYAIIYNKDGSIMVEGAINKDPIIYPQTIDVTLKNGEKYLVDTENVILIEKKHLPTFDSGR